MKSIKNKTYHLESIIDDLSSWEISLSRDLPLSPYVVMSCFAVEKTLKCLIRFVYNGNPPRTHNLETIMNQLPNEVFIKLSKTSGISVDDIKYTLIVNKNGFQEWRYVVEEGTNTGYTAGNIMNGIIHAGITELQSYLDRIKKQYPGEIWIK